MQYRHDLAPRPLVAAVLVLANVVVIREVYLEKGGLDWVNIVCWLLATVAVACLVRKNNNAG